MWRRAQPAHRKEAKKINTTTWLLPSHVHPLLPTGQTQLPTRWQGKRLMQFREVNLLRHKSRMEEDEKWMQRGKKKDTQHRSPPLCTMQSEGSWATKQLSEGSEDTAQLRSGRRTCQPEATHLKPLRRKQVCHICTRGRSLQREQEERVNSRRQAEARSCTSL